MARRRPHPDPDMDAMLRGSVVPGLGLVDGDGHPVLSCLLHRAGVTPPNATADVEALTGPTVACDLLAV